jgi:hypothetical protein
MQHVPAQENTTALKKCRTPLGVRVRRGRPAKKSEENLKM